MDAAALLVTLDGPAGAGKSTVARRLSRHYGLPLLDTGALYRAVALVARRRNVAWDDAEGLAQLAETLPIEFGVARGEAPPEVRLAGEDVTWALRTPEMSEGASRVSAVPEVRTALLDLQRRLGRGGVVAEGRDMGTVVFPQAPHKFFITAELRVRAARRHREDRVREAENAPDLQQVIEQMRQRDARDSSRAVAPLKPAPDAVIVDTTDLGLEQVVDTIVARIDADR